VEIIGSPITTPQEADIAEGKLRDAWASLSIIIGFVIGAIVRFITLIVHLIEGKF